MFEDLLEEDLVLSRRLAELGERWLIRRIVERLDQLDGSVLPSGDDAIDMVFRGRLLFSADMFLQSTDMPPGMGLRDVGYKAVTATTSDIASKGGRPIAYLISLALPPTMTEDEFIDLWRGFEEAAETYGGKIVGGDTNEGKEIVIDVICLAEAGKPVSRIGMRPGDLLAVTGSFGAQAAGLHALLNDNVGAEAEKVVRRFLRPRARVEEGLALAGSGALTSSMDSSDGLAETLHTLMEFNGLGFRITDPPVDEDAKIYAERFGIDLFDLVFYGGEEYELIVTIKRGMLDEAIRAVEAVGGKLLVIGEVIEDEVIETSWMNEERIVERRGYQHFSRS